MRTNSKASQNKGGKTNTPSSPEKQGHSALSLERIVDAAVVLLDANGTDGLTMRRLADHLNAGTMSVYWHVANKEGVFDLALNSVLRYQALPKTRDNRDWRMNIVHMLEDWRATMLRHPWSISLLPSRALGPSILSRLEWLSQTLSEASLADKDLNVAVWSFWNYVMGATITKANFDRTKEDRATAKQQMTDVGESYPSLERTGLLLDDDWDGAFRKGLDLLIDGLISNARRS